MHCRLLFLTLVVSSPVMLRAQALPTPNGADTLRSLSVVRYALDCTGPDGKPARISPTYDQALAASDADEPARVTRIGKPQHPKELIDKPGRVELQFVIDTTGRLEPCTISAETASDVRFVPAALAAIQCMRFTPARQRGRAVRVIVRQTVSFRVVVDR